jgi:hypothetical protein
MYHEQMLLFLEINMWRMVQLGYVFWVSLQTIDEQDELTNVDDFT